jgi:hypothetical protein
LIVKVILAIFMGASAQQVEHVLHGWAMSSVVPFRASFSSSQSRSANDLVVGAVCITLGLTILLSV